MVTDTTTLMRTQAQVTIELKNLHLLNLLTMPQTPLSLITLTECIIPLLMVSLFSCRNQFELLIGFPLSGIICDEHGNDLPPDTPPAPRPSDRGPDDWTPYNNRVEFEAADFIYRRNQMSGGDIDFIFNLWAASLVQYGDVPPFSGHKEMYDIIDSTPSGDLPWQSFSMEYNGILPNGGTPSWMTTEYDVWFRDPRLLVHHILSNPDFDGEIDYAPVQEYSATGKHRFQNFMSGNWCWEQVVWLHYKHNSIFLTALHRT